MRETELPSVFIQEKVHLMIFICGASSEFVSSSSPSWQILTTHAQPFRGARDLAFCLKVPVDSLLVWVSSGGSGETVRMRRLAWTFTARIGDKYQICLMWPIHYLTVQFQTHLCSTNDLLYNCSGSKVSRIGYRIKLSPLKKSLSKPSSLSSLDVIFKSRILVSIPPAEICLRTLKLCKKNPIYSHLTGFRQVLVWVIFVLKTNILKNHYILLLMAQFHTAPSNVANLASGETGIGLSKPTTWLRKMAKVICEMFSHTG